MTKKQLKQIIKECIRELQLNQSRLCESSVKVTDKARAFSDIMNALQKHGVRFYNNYSDRMSDDLYDKVKYGKITLIGAVNSLVNVIQTDHKDIKITVDKSQRAYSIGDKVIDKDIFSINGKKVFEVNLDDSYFNIY